MIYTNIPTKEFSKKQLKKIAKLSLSFCEQKFGVNRRKRFSMRLNVVRNSDHDYFGMYIPDFNTIEVYTTMCTTIGKLTSTIIHEYTHSLQRQDMRVYSKLLKEHGYWNHPFEVEARDMEKKFNRELLRFLRENW